MIFLKLGGSLITDKTRPYALRQEVLDRLAAEIAAFLRSAPEAKMLIGHGSGSFGHHAALENMPHGASGDPASAGRVWWAARRLHHHVLESLHAAGVPVVSFPPSAMAWSEAGQLRGIYVEAMEAALHTGWLPVVYGDVVLDRDLGAVIHSTESVFEALAGELDPTRLLLCGQENGVYADYPDRTQLLAEIRPEAVSRIKWSDAEGDDVTGGMAQKVAAGLAMAAAFPDLEVRVFSGATAGGLQSALAGEPLGTRLAAGPD